uniref:BPTI/Kunitz inhibitor domain-containing protein n=1 Tax=Xiphophorus couchianus TaxID=32473 RepID=A0A3B5MSS8_9TELE
MIRKTCRRVEAGFLQSRPAHGQFCNLPSDPGEGTTFTFFVYYKHEEDKCLPFFYQGQGGNANRFKSERDCNRTCVGIHGELITISSYLFVGFFL